MWYEVDGVLDLERDRRARVDAHRGGEALDRRIARTVDEPVRHRITRQLVLACDARQRTARRVRNSRARTNCREGDKSDKSHNRDACQAEPPGRTLADLPPACPLLLPPLRARFFCSPCERALSTHTRLHVEANEARVDAVTSVARNVTKIAARLLERAWCDTRARGHAVSPAGVGRDVHVVSTTLTHSQQRHLEAPRHGRRGGVDGVAGLLGLDRARPGEQELDHPVRHGAHRGRRRREGDRQTRGGGCAHGHGRLRERVVRNRGKGNRLCQLGLDLDQRQVPTIRDGSGVVDRDARARRPGRRAACLSSRTCPSPGRRATGARVV